jgi:small-conductance mechanosensitive channel
MQMNTLADTTFLGIPALRWAVGLLYGAVTVALLWGVREVLVSRLRNAATTETWVDDLLLALARRTSRLYMVAMGIAVAGLHDSANGTLPLWLRVITIAVFCLQLLRWANTGVDFWLTRMSRGGSDGQSPQRGSLAVVGILVRAAIFLVVAVLALDNVGVNVTALVTGLGITGIAVALAVQNILGDLLAALAIAFDKPFRVGDEITVGDTTGRVETVGLKTTRLRLGTGEEVSIANAEVMRNRLTNVSRTEVRMVPLTVGVAVNGQSGASLLALAAACEAALSAVPKVTSARARLEGIVDGRARIMVESVLAAPSDLAATRPLLISALTDAVSAGGFNVLGIA